MPKPIYCGIFIYGPLVKILTVPSYNRLVRASTSWGVGNGSLNVDDADKGYTGGPKERQWLVL